MKFSKPSLTLDNYRASMVHQPVGGCLYTFVAIVHDSTTSTFDHSRRVREVHFGICNKFVEDILVVRTPEWCPTVTNKGCKATLYCLLCMTYFGFHPKFSSLSLRERYTLRTTSCIYAQIKIITSDHQRQKCRSNIELVTNLEPATLRVMA